MLRSPLRLIDDLSDRSDHQFWLLLSDVMSAAVGDDDQTLVTLEQAVSMALAKRTGAHPSWLQMLDRLGHQLASLGR